MKLEYVTDKTNLARIFATAAHKAVGQKRKYTFEDYIVHPIEVANIFYSHIGETADTEDAVCASLLHDVVEDTQIDIKTITEEFGERIAGLVNGLTNVAAKEDGNRATRLKINIAHIEKQCSLVQTIKCCDIMSNVVSIKKYDKGFARVYVSERLAIVRAMTKANSIALNHALTICEAD